MLRVSTDKQFQEGESIPIENEKDGSRTHQIDYQTDEITAQSISQLCMLRSHDSVDKALDEAVLFHLVYMDMVRAGVELIAKYPDGRTEEIPLKKLLVNKGFQ